MTTTGLQGLDARPESISQMVYEAIRDGVIDKTLPPGGLVSEAGLARDLRVSKTPVREALLRLEELKLVERDSSRRLRVVQPSSAAIIHAYEARWALEPMASALACRRATDSDRTRLHDAGQRSVAAATAGDAHEFAHWDYSFHSAVAAAASNPYLTGLAKNALLLTRVLRARDVPLSGDSVKCAYQHIEIASAIERRDEESARTHAAQHVHDVMRSVLAAIDE